MDEGDATPQRTARQCAHAHGVPGVHLGDSETNQPAIGFSEHIGFAPAAVEPDGGLIMVLPLT